MGVPEGAVKHTMTQSGATGSKSKTCSLPKEMHKNRLPTFIIFIEEAATVSTRMSPEQEEKGETVETQEGWKEGATPQYF